MELKLEIFKNNKADFQKKILVDKFLNSNTEKYILGINENAKRLSKFINLTGYIDDFTNELNWNNKPVFKSYQILNKNAIIVSCSLAIYPISAVNSLINSGFKNILTVLDIAKYSDIGLQVMFISDAKKDLEDHFSKYEKIYNLLKDTYSKKIFKNLLNFRINFDFKYMKNFKVNQKGQYFENFLTLQDKEVFVDAGGFDGLTSVEFIKRHLNYKEIYIFEPSEKNLELAKENLKGFKNINFIDKGLSNKKNILKFNPESGSASGISDNGTADIEVDLLDSMVNEKVSFIKMDIEGGEPMAIEGMKKHILNDYPKMAISVYHKVNDLWKIPEQILAIRDDYNIYIRHYTEGTDETVMFFMPKL